MDMSAAEEILRAGKWKHEWVPVDYTAAKIKGHGHVPKGWQPGGKIRKPPDEAPVRHGWEPGPNDKHIQVEQVGTGGTSMGAFHRRRDAATLTRVPDEYGTGHKYEVRSHDTHELLGHVRPSSKPGHFVGESVYEPTGETNREYHGPDFMKAVHGVLGQPAYGYSWYRVKRGPGADVVKSRKRVSRALAHEPLGKPGGPGLFHHKGMQLPAYIQHIAQDLIRERGMPESEAIATAIAQCKRWAAGGENVHPDTRAKAAAAIAEWERLRASAHAKRSAMSDGYDSDGLDSSWDGDLSDLPDLTGLDVADFEAIAGPAEGGAQRMARLGSGARYKALKAKLAAKGATNPGALAAYIGRKKYGKGKFTALAAKARRGGGMHRAELFRSCPLEDYHIVRVGDGDGSGRVVEAYMTVFNEPAEIRDHQGHYREDIDRAAFNKRINDLQRSKNGFAAAKVFYNHGMTIHGSPSDRYSMPVAVCEEIRADTRGPVTRARYLDTPLGNEVLEMWRSGAITAQSFTGAIIRSDPQLRPGEQYRPSNGQLPRVRRLELGLKEFGPTPFPAYQGAELVGVRMAPLGTWVLDEEIDEELQDEALPPDVEAAAGEPQDEVHSTRHHQHALYALRSRELREKEGLAW